MKPDPQFEKDLRDSHPSVLAALEIMRNKGLECHAPEQILRPDFSQRVNYMDVGDIILGNGRIVQVKHRKNLDFTGYPREETRQERMEGLVPCVPDYPWSTAIVDERYKILKQTDKTWGYWIWNRSLTHWLWVPFKIRAKFITTRKFDKEKQDHCDFSEVAILREEITWGHKS